MSELEADLYVPQMTHLASDQEGTLGKTAGEDTFGSSHLSVNNEWAWGLSKTTPKLQSLFLCKQNA